MKARERELKMHDEAIENPRLPSHASLDTNRGAVDPPRPSVIFATEASSDRSSTPQVNLLVIPEINALLSEIELRWSPTDVILKFSVPLSIVLRSMLMFVMKPLTMDARARDIEALDARFRDRLNERAAKRIIRHWNMPRSFRRPDVDAIRLRAPFETSAEFDAAAEIGDPGTVRFQMPEAIIRCEDLEWRDDGHIVLKGVAARKMLANAALGIHISTLL